MGGQVGDRGVIESANGKFEVEDTIHLQGGKIGHIGHMVSGMFQTGETVTLKVDEENRALIGRNHSATHLLHKALRTVLGTHVEQAGSLVTRARLRFDFTHFSAMSQDEIKEVEAIVNKEIRVTDVMGLEDAKKTGAMALFGEKYGDKVRVVRMGDFSTELCGGTHVKNTSEISCFKILSEAGVAAGVRRIEALTSDGLINHYENVEQEDERSGTLDMNLIAQKLDEWQKASRNDVDRELINSCVAQITPLTNEEYRWVLDFQLTEVQSRNSATCTLDGFMEMARFRISFEEAKAFKASRNQGIRKNEWHDLTVAVGICTKA